MLFQLSPQLQARKTVHEKELKGPLPTQDSILMKIHWNDLADIKHPCLINTIANLVKMWDEKQRNKSSGWVWEARKFIIKIKIWPQER